MLVWTASYQIRKNTLVHILNTTFFYILYLSVIKSVHYEMNRHQLLQTNQWNLSNPTINLLTLIWLSSFVFIAQDAVYALL